MKKANQIKIGAMISYFSIGFNILMGLLYTPWMIEKIGQSQYGLYTLANSLITLFMVDFGLSSATARYVSKYHAEKDEESVNNFLGSIYKLYLIIDTVIMLVLIAVYFFIDTIYVNLTSSELEQFKVVYIIAASFSVINFPFVTLNGILTAYEKFIQLKLADLLYRFFIIVFTVAALLLGKGLYAVVAINAVVGLAISAYKWLVIKRTTSVRANLKFSDKNLYKDIFGFSIWVTISSLAQRLIFNITPSILGIVSNTSAIAVFGIVVTIESYSYLISSAINGMFMPKISNIYANDGAEKNVLPLLIKVGRFQYALNGLIIAGFALVGKSFITLWMGNDYLDAYYGILLVIIPGIFYNSLQIANTTMVVTKQVHLQAYVNIVMGITNVVLSVPLSKYYGVIGACISIFIAYTIRAIGLNILYYKKMKIDIPVFIRECYVKMSIPVIITIILGVVVNHFISNAGWITFAVKGCIVVGIYGVSLLFTALTKEERMKIIKKIFS